MKKILFLFTAIAFFGSASFSQLQFFPDAVDFGQVTAWKFPEIDATYNPGQPQNDGEFSENGISAIDQLKVGAVSVLDNSTDMEIYPNPARDILHIKTTFQGSCNWSLMNIQGILMMLGTFRNQTIIDIASLEPGIYLIKITNKDHVSVTSFVKQ